MPRGAPDWSNVQRNVLSAVVADLGELVARLSHYRSINRSGECIHYEDFSTGLSKWSFTDNLGGNTHTLSSQYACASPFSMCLSSATLAGGYEQAVTYIPMTDPSVWGIELRILQPVTTYSLSIFVNIYDGTNLLQAGIDLVYGTSILIITGLNGTGLKTITLPYPYGLAGSFDYLKLFLDVPNKVFRRLMIGDRNIDLSTLSMGQVASATYPSLQVGIKIYQGGEIAGVVYVGELIITQNED